MILGYKDDIVRTVKVEPICVLDPAESLRPILQFTLEEENAKGNAVPGFDLKVSENWAITSNWHKIQQILGLCSAIEAAPQPSISVVLSKALYKELLGVRLIGTSLIGLWKQ